MINRRINKIISRMNLPACLITDKAELSYLCGVDLEGFWLLLTKKGSFIVTSKLFGGQLKELLPEITVESSDNVFELLVSLLKKNKIKKLGLSFHKTYHSLAVKLSKSVNLIDINAVNRQEKDLDEIKNIRKSCKIAVLAMEYARKIIKPGKTEIEIYYKIDEFFAKNNVKQAFPTIVASGPNSASPHHVSSKRKIQRNDTVLVDMGCVYNGYCSDLTRTFYLGKINKSQKKVYGIVKAAQAKALKALKSGIVSSKVDLAARDIIKLGGYGNRFIHSTGHGVGIEIHEEPRLSARSSTVLKSGMVVTVEPGIYLEGEFGVRIEDTVLVTKSGYDLLTK